MSPKSAQKNEMIRAETKEKIKKAALKVFAERGFHGTTISKIAVEAGLSHGLVYHYFPSKEKVFRHLVEVALDSSISEINEVFDGPGTAWEKICHLSRTLVQNAIGGESSYFFLIMIQAVTQGNRLPGLATYIQKRSAEYFTRFVPLIAQAQDEGKAAKLDPVELAAAYYALLQGLAISNLQYKTGTRQISPEVFINLLKA